MVGRNAEKPAKEKIPATMAPMISNARPNSSRSLKIFGRRVMTIILHEDHFGMMAARKPGHFEIVVGSIFRCSATISGGECTSQSDNDIS